MTSFQGSLINIQVDSKASYLKVHLLQFVFCKLTVGPVWYPLYAEWDNYQGVNFDILISSMNHHFICWSFETLVWCFIFGVKCFVIMKKCIQNPGKLLFSTVQQNMQWFLHVYHMGIICCRTWWSQSQNVMKMWICEQF